MNTSRKRASTGNAQPQDKKTKVIQLKTCNCCNMEYSTSKVRCFNCCLSGKKTRRNDCKTCYDEKVARTTCTQVTQAKVANELLGYLVVPGVVDMVYSYIPVIADDGELLLNEKYTYHSANVKSDIKIALGECHG